jgi:hypothetical protein
MASVGKAIVAIYPKFIDLLSEFRVVWPKKHTAKRAHTAVAGSVAASQRHGGDGVLYVPDLRPLQNGNISSAQFFRRLLEDSQCCWGVVAAALNDINTVSVAGRRILQWRQEEDR